MANTEMTLNPLIYCLNLYFRCHSHIKVHTSDTHLRTRQKFVPTWQKCGKMQSWAGPAEGAVGKRWWKSNLVLGHPSIGTGQPWHPVRLWHNNDKVSLQIFSYRFTEQLSFFLYCFELNRMCSLFQEHSVRFHDSEELEEKHDWWFFQIPCHNCPFVSTLHIAAHSTLIFSVMFVFNNAFLQKSFRSKSLNKSINNRNWNNKYQNQHVINWCV